MTGDLSRKVAPDIGRIGAALATGTPPLGDTERTFLAYLYATAFTRNTGQPMDAETVIDQLPKLYAAGLLRIDHDGRLTPAVLGEVSDDD